MIHTEIATKALEGLLFFAESKGLVDPLDREFAGNLLLNTMGMDAPAEGNFAWQGDAPSTATCFLDDLARVAMDNHLIEDAQTAKDLFTAKLMGCVTPHPAVVRQMFFKLYNEQNPQAAMAWFYQMCRDCDYIKVDQVAKNVRYFQNTAAGELEITINLSKPEKDPKEIAKLKNAPQVGYPKCMLCRENPGYAGRPNFPARQNHRIVPVTLGGQEWFVQYSPYLYYPEHCIVFNGKHIPMLLTKGSFQRLFDFVDQFPHYFLGSNADLPIVGGSILNHDHFQGGHYEFPMDKAQVKQVLLAPRAGVEACILNWPMSTLLLEGTDRGQLVDMAVDVLDAWRGYSDPAHDILAQTEQGPHNTITPILRRKGDRYRLMLVLRNNRTSTEHPLGIFHPHGQLHHIKKENIGLIEVMGLFILPGRLKDELKALEGFLTGQRELICPDQTDAFYKHFDWMKDLAGQYGTDNTPNKAQEILRQETAAVCAQVLADAGVYKNTPEGLKGMVSFLEQLGFQG